MNYKALLRIPEFKYDAKTLMKWLWHTWRGNQLQAILNAVIGLLSVGISLGQVWAVKRAIDVASGTVEGDIYRAVGLMAVQHFGHQSTESNAATHARSHSKVGVAGTRIPSFCRRTQPT